MAAIGKDIVKAKNLLLAGQLVAIPTETVYGLAANALNEEAVLQIFEAKKRPFFNPLILHISSQNAISEHTVLVPESAKKLIDKFWPGPLTLLLKKKNVPDIVTSGLDTIGIRCPCHPLTQQLLKQLPFPLAAPSANPFGYISPTTTEHVNTQLGKQVPYILDGGNCEIGIESTIVGFDNNTPMMYRTGSISHQEIESVAETTVLQALSNSHSITPGSPKNHYAPHKQLMVGNLKMLTEKFATKKIGILCFRHHATTVPPEKTYILSSSGDLHEAAKKLFDGLHQLDKMDIEMILAEKVPSIGIGQAINDRLEKASSKII